MYKRKFYASGLAVMFGLSGYTQAQQDAIESETEREPTALEEVVVTATPFDRNVLELAQPIDVLRGDELRRKLEPSIGDTLSQELGISTSYFGPGAGRPIIRGLGGPRVRVLEGGIGALDVSTVSPDHAVTIDTLNAKQIEILRGPATLLYGSGASGGVVNVVTNRIPKAIPEDGLEGDIELRTNTVSDERTPSFDVTGGTGRFAWHADGFSRETNDYDIPGQADPDAPDSPGGRLLNSDIDSHGFAVGGSLLGENGFVGLSVSGFDSNYGVPGDEGIRIDLDQTRYDLEGELDAPLIGFQQLRFRAGYNDYDHTEIEGDGEAGTLFENEAFEGRVELLHNPIGAWQGVLGLQYIDRNFSAIGAEAFVPPTESRSLGVFIVEERNWDRWRLELGARAEHQEQEPESGNPDRDHNVYSLSAGTVWDFAEGYDLGLSVARAERAPSTEELYSNGPHLATQTFERSDTSIDEETSYNLDLALRSTRGRMTWTVNLFANRINDYIFLQSVDANGDGVADRADEDGTLDPAGELLLLDYTSADAEFYGAEAEAVFGMLEGGADTLDMRVFADFVRAELRDGGDLPRIPPLRYGLGFDYARGPWQAGISVMQVEDQDRVAALEPETDSYTLLDASVSYRIRTAAADYTLFLQGRNLLDEEVRNHTSFIKDFAPQPGLGVIAGIRASF